MQYSIPHLQARALLLATTVATTLAVLLAMAACACGESTEAVDAGAGAESSPAVEIPAVVEEAPAPSAEAAPEPTSPPPGQAETALPDPAQPVSSAVAGATSRVSEVASRVSEVVETSQPSKVVETVSHDTVEAATHVVESAGSTTPTGEVGKTGSRVLSSAAGSLRSTGDSLRSTADSLRETGRNVVQAGIAAIGGAEFTSPGPADSPPASPGMAGPKGGVGALSGSRLPYVGGPGGIEPLQLSTSNRSGGSAVGSPSPSMPSTGAELLSSGGSEARGSRPAASESSDGNGPSGPPPQTSPSAAPGLGGSFFVPIAALLALLALAAPAITRRLRERADLSPPLPFACALERPG